MVSRRGKRREREADQREADGIFWAWRRTAEGAGLCTQVETATGLTTVVPRLVEIVLGPPTVLVVELLPAQLPSDVRRAAGRIAPHLGAVALRVERLPGVFVRITLLSRDPLADWHPLALPPAPGRLVLGFDEGGCELGVDLADLAHLIVQGVTRSGKSRWLYGALAQLARDPRVLITGCDPTGVLWRPFRGSRHAGWQVSGVKDVAAHLELLRRLEQEMDQRIADLPDDRDTIVIGTAPDQQMRLVVLEELPGLYRIADALDKKTGQEVRRVISRLLAEGAKAGYRVLIVAQRAEASVVGAFERAQCTTKISFGVDNQGAVEFLHPGTPKELAEAHTTAAAGIALISAPGHELRRFRAGAMGAYDVYAAEVRAALVDDQQTGQANAA